MIRTVKDKNEIYSYIEYELSPVPLSLFYESGMRKTHKSALYSIFRPISDFHLQNCKYVVDRGHLLYKVVWPSQTTYECIYKAYSNYVVERCV